MKDDIELKKLGATIAKLRKAKGMSYKDLANKLEIEKTNYIPIEQGKRNITMATLFKIAKALDIEVKDLF